MSDSGAVSRTRDTLGPSDLVFGLALSTLVGAAAGTSPGPILPFLVAGLTALLLSLGAVARPDWLLYLVIITSATARLLQELGSVGDVTISGSRWAGVWAIAVLVILVNAREVRITRPIVLYGAFIGWVIFRWVTSGLTLVGFKDVIFYSLPVLLAIYTQVLFRRFGVVIERRLERLILVSAWIPICLFVAFLPTSLIDFTPTGPRGVLNPRAVSVYVVVVLCLFLARYRYAESKGDRARAGSVSLVLIAAVLGTLSRMSSALSLAALIGARVNPRRGLQLVFAGLLSIVLFSGVVSVFPPLRDRFFHQPPTDLSSAIRYFDWRGREVMWGLTLARAVQRPEFGWGPGSARTFLPNVLPGIASEGNEWHPHNEFLQVFHDLGAVGLALFVAAWFSLGLTHWNRWRAAHMRADLLLARWNLAAVLMIGVVLSNSLVDNTFHYMPIMSLVLVTIGVTNALEPSAPSGIRDP